MPRPVFIESRICQVLCAEGLESLRMCAFESSSPRRPHRMCAQLYRLSRILLMNRSGGVLKVQAQGTEVVASRLDATRELRHRSGERTTEGSTQIN